MIEVFLDIKYWGNSLGVRLPAAIAREAHLQADQRVRLFAEDGRVIIAPVDDGQSTLKQRLARYDPDRHGGEIMAETECLGAERW